jgi:L-fuculose-phosphate aldolase
VNAKQAAGTGGEARDRLIAGCQSMLTDGLLRGTSGNISTRAGDGMLITPSNVPYRAMTAAALVTMTLDGELLEREDRQPSSEWRVHARIYERRADVHAIVHTHSTFATALACMRRPIPPFHYMVAAAGGSDVPCTPYATFGTAELADHAAAALTGRDACLLANHGVVTAGGSVDAAVALAFEVESLAEQYCIALQAGEPVLLTEAEMAEALEAFASYRQ